MAEPEHDQAIDEALRKRHEAWRREQEELRESGQWIEGDTENETKLLELLGLKDDQIVELETRIEQLTKVLERIRKHSSEGLELFEHDCRFYLTNVLEIAMKTLSDLKKEERG